MMGATFGAIGLTVLASLGPSVAHAEAAAKGLTLSEAIKIALERSPFLRAAHHQVEAADDEK